MIRICTSGNLSKSQLSNAKVRGKPEKKIYPPMWPYVDIRLPDFRVLYQFQKISISVIGLMGPDGYLYTAIQHFSAEFWSARNSGFSQ